MDSGNEATPSLALSTRVAADVTIAELAGVPRSRRNRNPVCRVFNPRPCPALT
jgi:hypothetical protein